MVKKIAIIVALIIFLTNNIAVFASQIPQGKDRETLADVVGATDSENYDSLMEAGTTSTNGQDKQENVPVQTQSAENMFWLDRLICKILIVIPYLANSFLSQVTSDGKEVFTMQKVVSNHYDLFDLNYLVRTGNIDDSVDDAVAPIGKNVAIWFIGIRNLAIVASVIVLVYVGIRMAIATTSSKKAKFKNMLMSWVESVLFLLTLHIFIILLITVSNWLVGILNEVANFDPSVPVVEERIMTNISENLTSAHNSYGARFYTVLYLVFSYYQFKFFILYMGRLLRVAFYTIISPLVCVTIPIDKVGDGKAQSFENWILEIVIVIFMQPIHLLIYIITMFSISEILVRNPVIAIAFIALMSHAEKTFKSILKLKPSKKKKDNAPVGRGLEDIKLKDMVGGDEG